jgi:hypothetical protein
MSYIVWLNASNGCDRGVIYDLASTMGRSPHPKVSYRALLRMRHLEAPSTCLAGSMAEGQGQMHHG